MTTGFDQFRKLLGRLPVRAGYCVDCLSHLYGEPVETVREYLGEIGIASREAHCGHCGEHKDIVMPLLPPDLMRYRTSSEVPATPLQHFRKSRLIPETRPYLAVCSGADRATLQADEEGHMQVRCWKCSQPIALTDIIESSEGHLSHMDCKRPKVLTAEERALVFLYCSGHVVVRCAVCDVSYRYNELAADMVGGSRTNMCPRCRRDLTDAVRSHLFRCAMLPAEVRSRAVALRAAAQHLVKQSQQTRDRSDVLIGEAEATLSEKQRALREAMSRRTAF